MYTRQIRTALNDIIGAAEMFKFLYDEFGQIDTQKFSNYLAEQIGILYQIEQKIKTRQEIPGASIQTTMKPTDEQK
jgi:hypothetical protein